MTTPVTAWLVKPSPPPLSTLHHHRIHPGCSSPVRPRAHTSHMNLARHSISSTSPIQILDAHYDPDCRIFTSATPAGFAVYQTWPLKLLRKRGRPVRPNSSTIWFRTNAPGVTICRAPRRDPVGRYTPPHILLALPYRGRTKSAVSA